MMSKIITITIAVLSSAILFASGYVFFSYYKSGKSSQAHGIFAKHYATFEKLTVDQKEATKELIENVSRDYEIYKNSAYGPFLLALRSELQRMLGDEERALESMDKACYEMASSLDLVLYNTYATKLALMQIDASDVAIQTKGRKSLEKLAMNTKNPVRDMAWFYMGYQAYIDKDNQGVQMAWGKLFDAHKNPLSLWGVRAQSLLNYTA